MSIEIGEAIVYREFKLYSTVFDFADPEPYVFTLFLESFGRFGGGDLLLDFCFLSLPFGESGDLSGDYVVRVRGFKLLKSSKYFLSRSGIELDPCPVNSFPANY